MCFPYRHTHKRNIKVTCCMEDIERYNHLYLNGVRKIDVTQ